MMQMSKACDEKQIHRLSALWLLFGVFWTGDLGLGFRAQGFGFAV